MRKPVPAYYKLLEEDNAKYISRDELINYIEREKKGGKTPLKFPQEGVYYRRTAIDRIIITSLTLITWITFGLGIGAHFYIGYMLHNYLVPNMITNAACDFAIAALVSKITYSATLGNKFFVVLENDEDMLINLKRKSLYERQRIFKKYPECKDLYNSLYMATTKEEE